MKIFGFIPARYQSARFPGKPMVQIAGKPMIQRVYECAILCPEFSGVYVATDDERIAACVHEFGGRALITKKTHRSGTDRISEAAEYMGLERDDLVVNIQGDQPIFHPQIISQLVKPLVEDRSVSMTTLKYRVRDEKDIQSPKDVMVVTDNQEFALFFSRHPIPFFRDTKSKRVYYKHLGFYGFRMEFLIQFAHLSEGVLESAEKLEQLRALEHGFKIKVVETPFDSIEVDLAENIRKAEEMIRA